jgi:hypothetical protein
MIIAQVKRKSIEERILPQKNERDTILRFRPVGGRGGRGEGSTPPPPHTHTPSPPHCYAHVCQALKFSH